MALLFLEIIGPEGERLAEQAGAEIDAAVGFDPDLESATFDSDDHSEAELREAVLGALDEADPDWHSHLRLSE